MAGRYYCFINGVDTPIIDGTIPNVPGASVCLFYGEPPSDAILLVATVAREDASVLTRSLEPHGFKAATTE